MIPYTIIIPHYKVGKATAYTLYKVLQHTKGRDVSIIIIDNSNGEGVEYFRPFLKWPIITARTYPPGKIQSQGTAYDYAIPYVKTEYFITMESDSFPTKDNWLNSYDACVATGADAAGSLLNQSGGTYQHPAGALYKKSVWEEAWDYASNIDYAYFPNMGMKEGFGCHLMVHARILDDFIRDPEKYVVLHDSYLPYTPDKGMRSLTGYQPITGVFHNGMGKDQESIHDYGCRDEETEPPNIILDNKDDIIYRIGYEPGQWFHYYMLASGRQVYYVATAITWMKGWENQQQKYSEMINGFVHLWGTSAYYDCDVESLKDIVEFKRKQIDELYDTLPEEVKI